TWTALYIIMVFFQHIFEYLANINRVKLKKEYLINKRTLILNRIKNIQGNVLKDYSTGKIINIISDDLEQIGASFTTIFFELFKNVLMGSIAAIFLFRMNTLLFMAVILLQLVIVSINNKLSRKVQDKTKVFIKQKDANKQVLYDFISDIENIVLSNECEYYAKRSLKEEICTQNKFIDAMNLSFLNAFSGKFVSAISQIII
ncbi:TPA: ABC transporter ATP-binding protein, partial [Streptococcus pyogenes]|nr:ABC transporter ATP-binding protein [Streptococcus pyogenes]